MFEPSNIVVKMNDQIRFVWYTDLNTVTAGNPTTCTVNKFPAIMFDSGVKSIGDEYILDINGDNGFSKNSVVQIISTTNCAVSNNFFATIRVSSTNSDAQIGIAIGLTVAFFFLACCFVVVAQFLMQHWSKVKY